METSPDANRADITRLIEAFADHEPLFASLGTALLADSETTAQLVSMGDAAVPELIGSLNAENPKIVMYAAYCLGQIGDRSALPALQRAKARYMDHEPKREYDFSVISSISQAEEELV